MSKIYLRLLRVALYAGGFLLIGPLVPKAVSYFNLTKREGDVLAVGTVVTIMIGAYLAVRLIDKNWNSKRRDRQ